jgi:hypothetical protein
MGIDAQGSGHVGVTQHLGHHLDRHSLRQEQGRSRMPEVVHPGTRGQVSTRQQRLPGAFVEVMGADGSLLASKRPTRTCAARSCSFCAVSTQQESKNTTHAPGNPTPKGSFMLSRHSKLFVQCHCYEVKIVVHDVGIGLQQGLGCVPEICGNSGYGKLLGQEIGSRRVPASMKVSCKAHPLSLGGVSSTSC